MQNLLAFLAKYNHWFLFLLLEVVCAVLLFQYNSYQGSVWFSSANFVSGKAYEARANMESYFALATLNEQLTARNVVLEHQVEKLSRQLEALRTDAGAGIPAALKDSLDQFHLIPAKVVSNETHHPGNLITIDKGSADGVRVDMGVVCGTGIVGIVYLVSTHYSVVIPVLNSKSNISCKIQGRDYFGYLHWNGGSSRIAYVDDVPRHAHFRLKDKIVTSGYSSVFPPGLMVGKILHVFNSPDGLSFRLQVELSTDFGRLRDVCVIDDATMNERLRILRMAQDSIKSDRH
ncbi:MAG: rod shape-determining protein MreC [Prevotella sp.]|nr:rod shape-determining protein MreC [Prevotella sp.]